MESPDQSPSRVDHGPSATSVPYGKEEKPFDIFAEGLLSKNSRGDWPSFERVVAAIVDIAFSPSADSIMATQVALVNGSTSQSPSLES
jgi:hypothetical protein